MLIAQHSGESTYVPTIWKSAVLEEELCWAFARAATHPSVKPMPTSISLDRRDVTMCPVPEGNGMSVAFRAKYLAAKWRGVEKCSEGGC